MIPRSKINTTRLAYAPHPFELAASERVPQSIDSLRHSNFIDLSLKTATRTPKVKLVRASLLTEGCNSD